MHLAAKEHVDLAGGHLHGTRTWQRAKSKGHLDLVGGQVDLVASKSTRQLPLVSGQVQDTYGLGRGPSLGYVDLAASMCRHGCHCPNI